MHSPQNETAAPSLVGSHVSGSRKQEMLSTIKTKLLKKHGSDPVSTQCIDDALEKLSKKANLSINVSLISICGNLYFVLTLGFP